MAYGLLKTVHICLALLSITGFVVRWNWVMNQSRLSSHRLTRTLPHIIDTLFLASGLILAFAIVQLPFTTGWLTAKISGLVVYILLGMTAMSARLSPTGRRLAFLAAIISYSWIISVARSKSAWGFFSLLASA
jgi:uncharacterized membrane protein SirB2